MAIDYWKQAELKTRQRLLNHSIKDLDKIVAESYIKTSQKLQKQLLNTYYKILASKQPLASHLYQYNRYYDLINEIQTELTKLGNYQTVAFSQSLTNLYIANRAVVASRFGLSTEFDKVNARRAIEEIWVDDGLRFSDRIWADKAKLIDKLQQCLSDALVSGQSSDTLAAEIMKTFNVSYNEAKRLITTELAHASNLSTINTYIEAGVSKYRYVAEPGCCDKCSDLNGKIFPITDTEHLPPLHPFGKCSILAVI